MCFTIRCRQVQSGLFVVFKGVEIWKNIACSLEELDFDKKGGKESHIDEDVVICMQCCCLLKVESGKHT